MENIFKVRIEQLIKDPVLIGRFVKEGVQLFNSPNPDFAKFWKEVNDSRPSPK